jgi:hypothetical protein
LRVSVKDWVHGLLDDSKDQLTSQYSSELVPPSSMEKAIIKPEKCMLYVILMIIVSNFWEYSFDYGVGFLKSY